MIVEPSTTCELSERPLKAATVRVVRLLAAAIDHSVSPGCTTCGTAALAGAARTRANTTANSGVRRKALASCVVSDPTRLARHVSFGKRSARAYVSLHGILRRCNVARRSPADHAGRGRECGWTLPVNGGRNLYLWWQKWRWYERNSLPWNRARIHY